MAESDRTRRSSPAERDRREAKNARSQGRPIRRGNPYALLPAWVPYPLARLICYVVMPAQR